MGRFTGAILTPAPPHVGRLGTDPNPTLSKYVGRFAGDPNPRLGCWPNQWFGCWPNQVAIRDGGLRPLEYYRIQFNQIRFPNGYTLDETMTDRRTHLIAKKFFPTPVL